MAFEQIIAAIEALMGEIEQRPEDRHVLQEQLREKLSELRSLGLEVPSDLAALEEALSEQDENGDEDFDNMPV